MAGTIILAWLGEGDGDGLARPRGSLDKSHRAGGQLVEQFGPIGDGD